MTHIKLRVQNVNTSVDGHLDKSTYDAFKKYLGFSDDKAIWRARQLEKKLASQGKNTSWVKNWDGVQTTVQYNRKTKEISFPSGLLSRAREFFKITGRTVGLVDARAATHKVGGYSMSDWFEPRDYQSIIRDDACNIGRGIIKVATGGGKTALSASIIAELGCEPTIFYVTSNDLRKQAKDELEKFIRKNGQDIEVGEVGGGKFNIQPITVMTVQTAIRALGHRYTPYDEEDDGAKRDKQKLNDKQKKEIKDLIHSANVMVCDEVQHWAAKTCQAISEASYSARNRYGLSATPWRDLGDDMLIDACFGKAIADINASFLIDRDFLVKPTIYFVHNRLPNLEGAYQTVYKEGIVENADRNLMISNVAQKMVEHGRQVLILVRFIEHGTTLEAMIPDSFFIHGSHTEKQRVDRLTKMRQREASITISTSIFDEGVDVKPLDGLILGGSGKSQTRALQRVGRIIRPYSEEASGFIKKDAFVVDFQDNMKYMLGHSRKRRQIYETEPKFEIRDWK